MDQLITIKDGVKNIYKINPKISDSLKEKIVNEILDAHQVIDWKYIEYTPSY